MTPDTCARVMPHWVAIISTFGVLVAGNILSAGVGTTSGERLVFAGAAFVVFALLVWRRVQRYYRLDELHQRIELESLASAFTGSFLVFVAYWLLQIAGLFPPMNGLYFVIVMIALESFGTGGAWQRLLRRGESE